MAIPTLIPTVATLSDSSAQDHPHHHVSLGLGTDEIAFGEDKLACPRMEARPEVGEASPPKKVKREATGVETILKQTAEIEMVLVGMAALRGGAPPSPVECHLAVRAYTNLEGLVERVAPHDLVSKKFLQSLIQQFTLSQQPILALVSTPTPAQDVSTSSMEAFATPASAKAASTPGKRSRVVVKIATPKAAIAKAATPKAAIAKAATPKAAIAKAATPKAAAKPGVSETPITRLKDPRSVSITGVRVGKEPKSIPQVPVGAKIAQPLIAQRQVHQQIALAIQLSKPDVFMAALSETAGAYINSPIRCDTCKVLLNDTSSVLICDGCEAGFHLLCLQMYKHSDIPEKDWYCTKCVAVPRSQPRQPKYGPLRRGPGRRGSRTTWIFKSASEHPSTKSSEYMLKLRNKSGAQDGENLGAAKASSAVHASKDTHVESSSKTLET